MYVCMYVSGEGAHPLHPPPGSAPVSACDCELLWISSEGILKRVPGPSPDNASLKASTSCRHNGRSVNRCRPCFFGKGKAKNGLDWAHGIWNQERNVILRDWRRGLGLGDGCVPSEKRVKLSGYGFGQKVCTESFFRSFYTLKREKTLSNFVA